MGPKVVNESLAKPLALTAGILGLLQGLFWTVFSILSVCCYLGAIKIEPSINPEYYETIYTIFLKKTEIRASVDDDDPPPDVSNSPFLVTPREFFIFMWFYLAFSTIWTIVSGAVIWAMIHNQWRIAKYLLGSWSVTTILVSIVDIILTSLIGLDLQEVKNNPPSFPYNDDLIKTTYGIVMTIAARGYILWIVNVIFACILIKFTIDSTTTKGEPRLPIIDGFESESPLPPWASNNHQSSAPKMNGGFENPGFERSESFFQPPQDGRTYSTPYSDPSMNRGNNQSPSPTSSLQRVAKIGKQGRRSPPIHIPPPNVPFIPEPDYSPPGTPSLKSVLRSKSKY